MPPESDESSIERLKRTLYSRDEKLVPKEKRTPVAPRDFGVPTSWNDKPNFDITADTMVKRNNSFFNKFLIGSVLFFIVSIAIAMFIFLGGINMISSNNLSVEVVAPTSISSGEELSIGLKILNENRADLEETKLFIDYPEGSQSLTEEEKPISHEEINLGTVGKGDKTEYTVRTILFGKKDDIKIFNFRIEYKVKGSNAVFSKEKTYEIIIGSSPLLLEVKYPKEINSNQDIEILVDITSNSSVPLKDTLVKIDYPYGYKYKSSSIKPVRDNSVWSIGDLKNGDKKTLSLIGTLVGQNLEDRTFRISSGTKSGSTFDFDTTLASTDITLGIRKSFFDLTLNSTPNPIKLDQSTSVSIKWQNTLPDKVFDSRIEAVITGNAIDKNKVIVINDGFYRSIDDTVMWDKNTTKPLVEMAPGESGEVSVILSSIQNLIQPKLIKDPHFDVKVTITGERSGRDSGTISSTDNFTIKILTVLDLTSKVLRNVGPLSNTGSVPPKADKETTYTINWIITNTTSDIKNTVVTAELPQGVSWKGDFSPSSEKIVYDPSTRMISWNVGNVSAGSGYVYSPRQVYFKIGFMPSIIQIGLSPNIVNKVSATAIDTYSDKQVSTGSQNLTTKFSDPTFVSGQEQVVK